MHGNAQTFHAPRGWASLTLLLDLTIKTVPVSIDLLKICYFRQCKYRRVFIARPIHTRNWAPLSPGLMPPVA